MRFLTALLAVGCSANAPPLEPPPPPTDPDAAAPQAEPAELVALIGASDAVCACADAACADPAYERLATAVGERDLGAWTEDWRRRFHKARWRAEDCNLAVLSEGDGEVLEHAREALRDRFAAAAPALIEAVYQKARALHLGGAALPPTSAAETPAAGSCCRWSDGLCRPNPALWRGPPWTALGFAVADTQNYSLRYRLTGETTIEVSAIGDIDCDGELGTFEIRGDVATQSAGLIRLTRHLE